MAVEIEELPPEAVTLCSAASSAAERIRKEYAEARSELTSLEYWKNYLKME